MKLKKLDVSGFRSLAQLSVSFDDELTIIVGENDAGKTSLIECLKVVAMGRPVSIDDFTHGANEIIISLATRDFAFRKKYKKSGDQVAASPLEARPTEEYINGLKEGLADPSLTSSTIDGQAFVKEAAKVFGLAVRANSNMENLKSQLLQKISTNDEIVIEGAIFPEFSSIQLDGKHFENVPAFFKEVFLKEKQASIWQEEVREGTSIESFVRSHLDSYSKDVSTQIRERGIISKLQLFLPELTDIKIEAMFSTRDLNVDARVKFLENGNEIALENKGDGTRRRMTMALLEFKKVQSGVADGRQTIYLLDEPDTHLHVKAQLHLMNIVDGFSSAGDQVILTTHSPFIVNVAKPSQIRLLARSAGTTSIRSLSSRPDQSSKILRALGIENTHLFFSKKIVIVEGQTEESFLPAQYLKQTGRTLSSGLVKLINVHGVHNIVGFSRAILELHNPLEIYILCDNDASADLQILLNQLEVPQANKFQVGSNEFEDAFHSSVLHRVWVQHHVENGRDAPGCWTQAAIERLKAQCSDSGEKFSKRLRSLNQGGKTMTKPIFGAVLGERVETCELPPQLRSLLEVLTNA